ncbi:YveK family protein [Lacticaseibacillus pantheris]|uniref:YveK family protein n=1 Tax=Lacticaseibacillus pantheris TaxID=171523 RepID=UPI0026581777|nr:Wzz/FepE/Etk N-terminal domain-containing protein [Lacticaseibacillus pantheris]WKF84749.1 Wzz/FepE/Etk N-terminal domain-containing protein [Lacticaseibacillus pantheris]
MKNEIEVKELFLTIKHSLVKMIALAIIFGGLAFVYTHFIESSTYSAQATILVNNLDGKKNGTGRFREQQADIQVITTYKEIARSQPVLKAATKELTSNHSNAYAEKYSSKSVTSTRLGDKVSVTSTTNSQLINITAKTKSAKESRDYANAVANAFTKHVQLLMHNNDLTVSAPAVAKSKPVSKHTSVMVVTGIVFGAFVGFAWEFVRERVG